jgi:flagellar basal body-associated protein FliL
MIKLVGTGVWVLAVTLAAVYFSLTMASAPKVDAEAAAREAAMEFVTGYTTTVPVIGEGGVNGYLLTKLAYKANKELAAKEVVPLPQLITDELYTLLVGKKMIDVTSTGSFDLDAFRGVVKEGLNRRFGAEVIAEVYVEQIDYITTASVEDPAPRKGMTLLKGDVPDADAAEKSSGH